MDILLNADATEIPSKADFSGRVPDADTINASNTDFMPFASRRSVVHSINGIVACTQPLAAQAGQTILKQGGNAADAAIAVAAALNMTEPAQTGIGGDMFCLFYNSKTKKVHALNGSGRAPNNSTLQTVRHDLKLKPGEAGVIPRTSIHAITVPGAAAGWVDTVEKFGSGKLSLEQILTPAIELGEEGFPVSELSSSFVGTTRNTLSIPTNTLKWQTEEKLLRVAQNFGELLKDDINAPGGKRAPLTGEIFQNRTLAQTFRLLAKHGKKGFYEGPVAEALVKVVQDLGGHLTLEDLKYHADLGSEVGDPISLKFTGQNTTKPDRGLSTDQSEKLDGNQGVEIWEHPPNGQGLVALMALGIIEELERTGKISTFKESDHNSAKYLHVIIESLRIAFADAAWWVADPKVEKIPTRELISQSYLRERAKLFDPNKAANIIQHGSPAHNHCDTVLFTVTDKFGNGISFINSLYHGFGTCIVPQGCGFAIHSRGANFSLEEGHPNVIAPRKRPYHTIIPAMVTNLSDQSLNTVYGVMGGFMQPQGHVQVLLNMLTFKYNPQSALDAPRICIGGGTKDPRVFVEDQTVFLEEGIGEDVAEQLRALGHKIKIAKGYARCVFGRGQVIRCHTEDGRNIYSAGSDFRGDGAAFPA